MVPLAPSEIEEKLSELEERIEQMRAEEQRAWGQVLAFLKEQRHGARMEQANLDRVIGGLESEPGE